jgi:hypothetical protein
MLKLCDGNNVVGESVFVEVDVVVIVPLFVKSIKSSSDMDVIYWGGETTTR